MAVKKFPQNSLSHSLSNKVGNPRVVIYPVLFNRPRTVAPGILQLKTKTIESYIQDGAAGSDLTVSVSSQFIGQSPGSVSGDGVSTDMLKGGLNDLFSVLPKSDITPVGLFLTDSYESDDILPYGMMFDAVGRDGSFGPRQGCAVFLDSIAPAVGGAGDKLNEFVAFSALHELGHAFNLWHIGGDSIMQPSPSPNAMGSCKFDPLHTTYLARAADTLVGKDVMPGGSNFGDRPSDCGAPPGSDSPFESAAKTSPQFGLTIKLSHEAFWAFEPIEMELKLSLKEGKQKTIELPKELDPAFEGFQIWLTNPRGERRIFSSDVRICQSNAKMVLEEGKPFRRDVSLLRELGHATFSFPGAYEVQVVIRLPDGKIVRSNVARCKIKPPEHDRTAWEAARKALYKPSVQRLFRYKRTAPPEIDVKAMLAVAAHSSDVTASMIHYALGKTFARKMNRPGQERKKQTLRKSAAAQLERALKIGNLGVHRRAVTTELLSKLEGLR
jgi:hypothetical protein